jgi:hypothetical protein
MTCAMIAVSLVIVGIILGLVFGPSVERLTAAHTEGFIEGYNLALEHARQDPRP